MPFQNKKKNLIDQLTTRSGNSLCPCGSQKKWKHCHGWLGGPVPRDEKIGFDPMASLLEKIVSPQIFKVRQIVITTWVELLTEWIEAEDKQKGYDTERLERLISLAWKRGHTSLNKWDSRFSLQVVRTIPVNIVAVITQIGTDRDRLVDILRLVTAAAVASKGKQWNKSWNKKQNWITLSQAQQVYVTKKMPSILGNCFGAAWLLTEAQYWYRWVGKGKKMYLPTLVELTQIKKKLKQWNGDGIFLMPSVNLSNEPNIDRAVKIYMRRSDIAQNSWFRSGLICSNSTMYDIPQTKRRMWSVTLSSPEGNRPVYIPSLNFTYTNPSWYPDPRFNIEVWIETLRPFEHTLKTKTGLDCNQLLYGLKGLGLVIERQTQCGYLKAAESKGKFFFLDSPTKGKSLRNAVSHLASILLRGMLRVPLASFLSELSSELENLGWEQPDQLANDFITTFSGIPIHHGLPTPILFYIIDPLTCVLDLTCWHDFVNACSELATSGDGAEANKRGRLFEEQVVKKLTTDLSLKEQEIPLPPNTTVTEKKRDRGDVDFCFLRNKVLFNLDMKSWRRTSEYHIGHYHTIQNRLQTLTRQMIKVEKRGATLQRKLVKKSLSIKKRMDFLVVPFPEYIAPNNSKLWYKNNQYRVITPNELIQLVKSLQK